MAKEEGTTNAFGSVPRAIVGLSRMVELALEEVDLTVAQYRLLGFCAKDATTPTEVAVWLSVKKQSVTSQLDALVMHGFLTRTNDEGDRRRILHEVTPAGRQKLADADAAIQIYYDVVNSTLTSSERRAADRGLALAGTALTRIWNRARATSPPRPITGWMSEHAPEKKA